mmetsp:Transcript_30161/g.42037  ORF Transcript_30161/g.42037 Transcript_30161/m.42037 type:complete len:130 (+) Transcript_30161:1525-1914(+)
MYITQDQKVSNTIIKSSWILLGLIINRLEEKNINLDLIFNVFEKISIQVSENERKQLLSFLKSFNDTLLISRGEDKINQLNQLLTKNTNTQVNDSQLQEDTKEVIQSKSSSHTNISQNDSEESLPSLFD